jgi:hypothetical protein
VSTDGPRAGRVPEQAKEGLTPVTRCDARKVYAHSEPPAGDWPRLKHSGLLPAQTHAAHTSYTGHAPDPCHSSTIVAGAHNASPRSDVAG